MDSKYKKPKDFGKKISAYLMGKTFEDRFGKEKSDIAKQKISINSSKSWDERMGKKTSNKLKKQRSIRMKKKNPMHQWSKEEIKQKILKYKQNNKLFKKDLWAPNGRDLPSMTSIKKFFKNLDELSIELGFTFDKHNRSLYLKEHPEVLNKIIKHNVNFQKHKTYEQRYSKQKNNKIKEILKNHMLKRFETEEVWNKGIVGAQIAWNKGKTKESDDSVMRYSIKRREYMMTHKGNFISTHEKIIMDFLKESKIDFISQYYVGDISEKYLADIFIKSYKLIIEIDGTYWHNKPGRKEKDVRRTKQMEEKGYVVLRFTDKEVEKELDKIKHKILEIIKMATNHTHNNISIRNKIKHNQKQKQLNIIANNNK